MSNKYSVAIVNEIKGKAGLSTDAKIVLHTRIVQSLFNGSWKRGRMGLLQFAKTISALWQAAKEDDPYAEWYLLKTYQALFDARNHLKSMEDVISNCLNTLRGVEVRPFECITPITYPLNFSTPFGYMGAYLIADADFVLRQLLTLERVGIPLPEHEISFKSIVRYVQEAFAVPRDWARTGIKRKDIREQNDKFKMVTEKFGILPESVMEKRISFAFLPKTKE
jgi:integrating conjugative element protein (TIGR03761 family)